MAIGGSGLAWKESTGDNSRVSSAAAPPPHPALFGTKVDAIRSRRTIPDRPTVTEN
jgi:hypothetical protein